MASFAERLHQSIAEYNGEYDPVMRRSFQTVLMFEANRCLKDKLPSLRPFQRKLAVFDQAKFLLEEIGGESSLLGLRKREKMEEIMWRTASSREPLNAESMWSRAARLTKDVERVAEQVREFIEEQKSLSTIKTAITSKSTHEEIYRSFVENIYDKTHPNTPPGSEAYPVQFEFTHSHLFLAYKMYYRKGNLDPYFPKPREREIIVPKDKPVGGLGSYGAIVSTPRVTTSTIITNATASTNKFSRRLASVSLTESPLIVAAGQKASAAAGRRFQSNFTLEDGDGDSRPLPDQQELPSFLQNDPQHNYGAREAMVIQQQNEKRRRDLLREVKDHMDLLSQFEGVIDAKTIKKRKRALFLSLPPPPPPNEDTNSENEKTKSEGKRGSCSETESDDEKNSD